ncbi:transposase [Streptomyces umbrinus]|uniref:transposase n=1 Tax=Streptomyces umbrinus TaxID=67370 RepID=UPI0033E02264
MPSWLGRTVRGSRRSARCRPTTRSTASARLWSRCQAWHVVVDCLGLVLAVLVTAASVQDRDAAVGLLKRLRRQYLSIRLVWADGGYSGSLVDFAREKLQLTLDIVRRTDDTTVFVVLPRRWVVERTLSWLMRSRHLVRDYETLPAMHEAMVLWSMTMLMTGRLAGRRRNAFIPRQPTPSS